MNDLLRKSLDLAKYELGSYKRKTVEELKKIMAEKDPNGKSPHELGAKLDTGKAPIFQGLVSYFPRACLAVSEVSAEGAKKYAWKGWISVPDGINRYTNAMIRHLCKEEIEGPIDADFGLLHAAHAAWNAMAVLELKLMEQEKKVAEPNVKNTVVHNNTIVYNTVPSSFAAEQINKSKPTFSRDADLTPGL